MDELAREPASLALAVPSLGRGSARSTMTVGTSSTGGAVWGGAA